MKLQKLLIAIVVAILLTLGIITIVRYMPIPGISRITHFLKKEKQQDSKQGINQTETDHKLTGTAATSLKKTTTAVQKTGSTKVIEVTNVDEIKEMANSTMPMVIKFYTSWCPACIMAKTIFPTIAQHFKGKVQFYSINLEQEAVVKAAEENNINKEQIEAIPTFVFLQNGKVHDQIRGFPGEQELEKMITEKFDL